MSRRRAIEWAEALLLLVAGGCLGYWVYSHADAWVYQSYSEYKLEQMARNEHPTWLGYLDHLISGEHAREGEESAYEGFARKSERPAIVLGPDGLVGRIEIPRLDVAAVVREGVDAQTLRRAVGHVPGTAFPGEKGNAALAGHRDTFFRGLRSVQTGDSVRVVAPSGTFEYKVESMKIVTPKDVGVLDDTDQPVLTLVTCYPFNYIGHAPKRFIVRARLVSENTEARLATATAATESVKKVSQAPKKKVAKKTRRIARHAAAKRVPPPAVSEEAQEKRASLEADDDSGGEPADPGDDAINPPMERKSFLSRFFKTLKLRRKSGSL